MQRFFLKFFLILSWRRPLSHRNQSIDLLFKSVDWFLYDNDLRHERVKMGKKWRKMLRATYSLKFKNIILFLNRGLYLFSNGHIRNVVSTLPNVVKIDVENDNVGSTLSNVVQFNVEKHNVVNFNVDIHNVVLTLIWRCSTSRPHINLKTTLNRSWNVCWVIVSTGGNKSRKTFFCVGKMYSSVILFTSDNHYWNYGEAKFYNCFFNKFFIPASENEGSV